MCSPQGKWLASRRGRGSFSVVSASPGPRRLLLEYASKWKLWLWQFLWYAYLKLTVYFLSNLSCWTAELPFTINNTVCLQGQLTITSIMDCMRMCVMAIIRIFHIHRSRILCDIAASLRPRRNCLEYITDVIICAHTHARTHEQVRVVLSANQ